MRRSDSIPLPFILESVVRVLAWGSEPDTSPYSHKQIAEWCDSFWCEFMDVDVAPDIERLLPILADVDVQWDLFLANTYSFDQLRSLSLDEVRLPKEWFAGWLAEAKGGENGV
ncbi:MAG: hypothetical protein K2Y28_05340 [Burkholderiaceae bacterium]|nr:hypothetical protein [Burkholderiaceae bacterium]